MRRTPILLFEFGGMVGGILAEHGERLSVKGLR
jgi:hypothetical protein